MPFFNFNSIAPSVRTLAYQTIDTYQEGPRCKLAALRTCMKLLDPDHCYPLIKRKQPNTPLSVRSIAKKHHGSAQGEVTSPERLTHIARSLGLTAKPERFHSLPEMEHCVHSAIDQGRPVIVFIQLDTVHGSPATKKNEYNEQCYEHACVVVGYDQKKNNLIVHDGIDIQVWKSADVYQSSCKVVKSRTQETYVKFMKPGQKVCIVTPNKHIHKKAEAPTLDDATDVRCHHYFFNETCRYHDISAFLHASEINMDRLEQFEESGYVVIRRTTQEPDGNFHKLAVVVSKQ